MNLNVILIIILIITIVDIYIKLRNERRHRVLNGLIARIIGKILISKQLMTPNDFDKARKDVLNNLSSEDYNIIKKELLKIGVDIEADLSKKTWFIRSILDLIK